jgi:5-methylthioadenosine/S-adenosylhomocysteine deaminase
MVTDTAARVLGVGDLTGSLEVGKRADVIMISLNKPHLVPLYDPYSHLVYAIGRDDISTVLVNGRIVMRDRQILTIDEGALLDEVKELALEIAELKVED